MDNAANKRHRISEMVYFCFFSLLLFHEFSTPVWTRGDAWCLFGGWIGFFLLVWEDWGKEAEFFDICLIFNQQIFQMLIAGFPLAINADVAGKLK